MSCFRMPGKVFSGEMAMEEAIKAFLELGTKGLIVTGKHVGRSPMFHKLVFMLEEKGIRWEKFDGITGEPTDGMIEKGVEAYKNNHCDFVIGIGGGSPLDSAKAIAAMTVLPGKITDYMGKDMEGDFPGIGAIPTTAGTGSEATKFVCITDSSSNVKMLLKGDSMIPDVAVINPEFTRDMPQSVIAATGLDALTHAVEAYTSKKATEFTDVLARSAVRRIMENLPRSYTDSTDLKAKKEMALAAFEAGVCINNSSVTLVHGMSRPIGALFHVPHGLSNAMLLKDCLEFALPGALARFADLGRITETAQEMDSDERAAQKFITAIGDLCKICELSLIHI